MNYVKALTIVEKAKNGNIEKLEDLSVMLINQINENNARFSNQYKLYKRMETFYRKQLKKEKNIRPDMAGWSVKDGKSYAINGYVMAVINQEVDIQPRVKGYMRDFDKIMENNKSKAKTIEAISFDMQEIKTKCEICRAYNGAKASKKPINQWYAIGNIYLNPILLRDLINVLGHVTEVQYNRDCTSAEPDPVILRSNEGEGIIMPVRVYGFG